MMAGAYEVIPKERLLPALGRLARGLSALFWGLPVALIVCFHTAQAESLRSLGVVPPLLCTGWLAYGVWQIRGFQTQEIVWRNALDRARLVSLILLGLSPFLYWSNRVPGNPFFLFMVVLMAFFGLLFLGVLNHVIQRLGAMLPDEALRLEIRQFTFLNFTLLGAMLVLSLLSMACFQYPTHELPELLQWAKLVLERAGLLLGVPLLLLPLAMTMALLWKTKEVILESLFSGKH